MIIRVNDHNGNDEYIDLDKFAPDGGMEMVADAIEDAADALTNSLEDNFHEETLRPGTFSITVTVTDGKR